MTEDELTRLSELPELEPLHNDGRRVMTGYGLVVCTTQGPLLNGGLDRAELIVSSVNALPDLIDEVRRLQWEVARLRHNIDGAMNWASHAIKYADTLATTDLHLPVQTCSLAGAHHAAGAAVRALLTDGDEVTP